MNTAFKLLPLALAIGLITSGCDSSSSQDTQSNQTIRMNGMAVDGRIANARVWVDRNNNGRLDRDFEPWARTDSQGFYSFNPERIDPRTGEKGVDYCSFPTDHRWYRHCLSYSSNEENVVIRIRGGIDIDTGEPLKAPMRIDSTQTAAKQQGENNQLVASPISTLLAQLESTMAEHLPSQVVDVILDELWKDSSEVNGDLGRLLTRDFSSASTDLDRSLLANAVSIINAQFLLERFEEGSTRRERQEAVAQRMASLLGKTGAKSPLERGFVKELVEDLLKDDIAIAGAASSTSEVGQPISVSAPRALNATNSILQAIAERPPAPPPPSGEPTPPPPPPPVQAELRAAETVAQIANTSLDPDIDEETREASQRIIESIADDDEDDEETSTARKQRRERLVNSFRSESEDDEPAVDIRQFSRDLTSSQRERIAEGKEGDLLDDDEEITRVSQNSRLTKQPWSQEWIVLQINRIDEKADNVKDAPLGAYIAFYFDGDEKDSEDGDIRGCAFGHEIGGEKTDESFINGEYFGGNWNQIGTGRAYLVLNAHGFEHDGNLRARSMSVPVVSGYHHLYNKNEKLREIIEDWRTEKGVGGPGPDGFYDELYLLGEGYDFNLDNFLRENEDHPSLREIPRFYVDSDYENEDGVIENHSGEAVRNLAASRRLADQKIVPTNNAGCQEVHKLIRDDALALSAIQASLQNISGDTTVISDVEIGSANSR